MNSGKVQKFLIFLSFFCSEALVARQTKEEKSLRRSEYWGMYSDLNRALTCLNFYPTDSICVEEALKNSAKHAENLDRLLANQSNLRNTVTEILKIVQTNQSDDVDIAIRTLLSSLSSEFAGNLAPVVQPKFENGLALYNEYCQSCHGDGRGHPGNLTSKLKNVPRPFNLRSRDSTLTPFGVYATMIHGIENSEMSSFLEIMDVDELWAVSFYVNALRFSDVSTEEQHKIENVLAENYKEFALSNLAVSNNSQIIETLKRLGMGCGECQVELGYIRKHWSSSQSAIRLGESAHTPVQKAEYRALKLLLLVVSVVSIGFYLTLRRRSRLK